MQADRAFDLRFGCNPKKDLDMGGYRYRDHSSTNERVISFSCPDDYLRSQIEQSAFAMGLTMSEFMRALVAHHFGYGAPMDAFDNIRRLAFLMARRLLLRTLETMPATYEEAEAEGLFEPNRAPMEPIPPW